MNYRTVKVDAPTFSPGWAAVVVLGIALSLLVLCGRVAWLGTVNREQTISRAERQHYQNQTLRARRGSIFDAHGNLLAGTVQIQNLFIDPHFMHQQFQTRGRSLVEMDDAVERLARLIGMDSFELSRMLGERHESRFIRIAENLDDRIVEEIRAMRLPGVGIQPGNVRYYPMGSIAAHLLGGTRRDGPGLDGLEFQFDELLAGEDGRKRSRKDARRRSIAVAEEDYHPPRHGQHLILTIDANIQMIAEQELAATCREFDAERGEVVVMDPRTGEILALANWPTFNPQNIEDSTPEMRRNRALVDPYEPGSTLKPFIAGPALAAGHTRVDEVFPIEGPVYRTSYGRRITDVSTYEELAMWDVLVKSSNIGMAMLAERMGNSELHQALRDFGFGERTGIDLPGENRGHVFPLDRWTRYSTESIAMGYEMMLTPLQLARAFCAYANGGRLVTPRILKGTLEPDGSIASREEATSLQMMPQVIDPITAAEMKRVLSDTPIRGTAMRARSRTWNIFGKTGTARISRGGNYHEAIYTASFVGGAPAENPRLVIAFVVHQPDRSIAYYGGTVSGPGASRILERSLAYLGVPASPDLPAPPRHIANVLLDFNPNLYGATTATIQE